MLCSERKTHGPRDAWGIPRAGDGLSQGVILDQWEGRWFPSPASTE
jgi:hypothetical protein